MRVRSFLVSCSMLAALGGLATGCRDSHAAPLHGEGADGAEMWHAALAVEEPPPAPGAAATIVSSAAGPTGAKESAGSATITISAVGDCTLGSDYRVAGAEGTFHLAMDRAGNDFAVPFANVVGVLGADDLTIANLETPLSRAKPAVDHTFVFNGKPEYAKILAKGSVELVNLANNHTGDFGAEGAKQTVEAVEKAGVGAFGNGRVDRRMVKGVEVVNMGYLGGGKGTRERVVKDVKKHKRTDNLVIVSFHWGVEGLNVPVDDQRKMARAVIDAGADLILGHHPHVLQGIETYRGKHIVYSLANFVFGGHSNPADKDSMIYQEVFALEGGRVVSKENRVLPVRISSVKTHNDFRPVLLEGAEKERVLARVKAYSDMLAPAAKR
jgi:poly-gamma-glutamate capsule biosynthesis protein CapA/YwtB (metallophosphatase superfamily)